MANNIRTLYEVDDGFIGTVSEISEYLKANYDVVRRDIREHYKCNGHYIRLYKRIKIEQIYTAYDTITSFTFARGTIKQLIDIFHGFYSEGYLRQVANKHLLLSQQFYLEPTGEYVETILKRGE